MVEPKLTLKKANGILDGLNERYKEDGNLKDEIIKGYFEDLLRRRKAEQAQVKPEVKPEQGIIQGAPKVNDTVPTSKPPAGAEMPTMTSSRDANAGTVTVPTINSSTINTNPAESAPKMESQTAPKENPVREQYPDMTTSRSFPPALKGVYMHGDTPYINHINNRALKMFEEGLQEKDGSIRPITEMEVGDVQHILTTLNKLAGNDFGKYIAVMNSIGDQKISEETGETYAKISKPYSTLKNSLYKHVVLDDGMRKSIYDRLITNKPQVNAVLSAEDIGTPSQKHVFSVVRNGILTGAEGETIKNMGIKIGRELLDFGMDVIAKNPKQMTPEELEKRDAMLEAGDYLRNTMGIHTFISQSNMGAPAKAKKLIETLGAVAKSEDSVYYDEDEEDLSAIGKTYFSVVR